MNTEAQKPSPPGFVVLPSCRTGTGSCLERSRAGEDRPLEPRVPKRLLMPPGVRPSPVRSTQRFYGANGALPWTGIRQASEA